MIQRYFIKLAYDGSHYHGWQIQENASTVQGTVEEGLSVLAGNPVSVVGCGRTDTGVHASEFYAHFDHEQFSSEELNNLVFKLNSILPEDISVSGIFPVASFAHARFSAIARTYQYYIRRYKEPFNRRFAYYFYGDLDVEKMNQAAAILIEYEDFTSFSKLHTQVKTNLCKIKHAYWNEKDGTLVFTISADRFLRDMVRAIVGTLMDVGRTRVTFDEFRRIIELKDRSSAGKSVPAHGLFLTGVEYPEELLRS